MSLAPQTMPRKKSDKPKRPVTTVKIPLDLAEMARAVVAHEGGELTELYDSILRAPLTAHYSRAVLKAAARIREGGK